MRLPGPVSSVVAGAAIASAILASCSGGHGSSSSTTTSAATSTSVAESTTSVAPTTVPRSTSSTTVRRAPTTTIPPAPPTTGGSTTSSVRINDLRVMPPSPVSCNAPTMIELTWTSSGASTVTLSIDGKPFATFGPGPQDHLEYFACDGHPHTYTLSARSGGATATASTTVRSR